ncbi:hypothetical protein O5O45_09375 [Hahella aquimaris]|uniref:hypothetical protein n=1 Tax=Hahella sp. HNIBRBA332 TaxID=3015983 RepID=UPI00273B41D8|nr:hypothetical protein [Hahella sp. HNIBRBA332]WLQ16124.1 hypothetical protein O5O45_09375 [Hahella sp. HNIBRBA332]
MSDASHELLLSPNPLWHYYWVFWMLVLFSVLLIQLPLAYVAVVRPFDKKFEMKNIILERGIFYGSFVVRLTNYVHGIVFEPYRGKLSNPIAKRLIDGKFEYQDRLYEKRINMRSSANSLQIALSYILIASTIVMIVGVIPLIIHNFILYPEFAAARGG